jgi:hypothetical protein
VETVIVVGVRVSRWWASVEPFIVDSEETSLPVGFEIADLTYHQPSDVVE